MEGGAALGVAAGGAATVVEDGIELGQGVARGHRVGSMAGAVRVSKGWPRDAPAPASSWPVRAVSCCCSRRLLPWFGIDSSARVPGTRQVVEVHGNDLNAWEAFAGIDLVLAIAAALAIAALAVGFLSRPPLALWLAVAGAAAVAALLIVYRLIDPPSIAFDEAPDTAYETGRRLGAFFGLLCTGAIAWGANLAGAVAPAKGEGAAGRARAGSPPRHPRPPGPSRPARRPRRRPRWRPSRAARARPPLPLRPRPPRSRRALPPLAPLRPSRPARPRPARDPPSRRARPPLAPLPPLAPCPPSRPTRPPPARLPPHPRPPSPPARSAAGRAPRSTPRSPPPGAATTAVSAPATSATSPTTPTSPATVAAPPATSPPPCRPGGEDLAGAVPGDAWGRGHLSGKSSRTLGVGLLGLAAKRDPSLAWLWDSLGPLPPPGDDEPRLEFAHVVAPELLGERPRQTSFDALVDDSNVLIGVETKWREHGIGGCLCRGDGVGPEAGERCSRRVETRAPYWASADDVLGLGGRAPGAPCPISPVYELVRHAAALRALAGPERLAVLALLYDAANPYFAASGDWPGWPALIRAAVSESSDPDDFRFVALSWQELVPELPLDQPARAWAADKHGLD